MRENAALSPEYHEAFRQWRRESDMLFGKMSFKEATEAGEKLVRKAAETGEWWKIIDNLERLRDVRVRRYEEAMARNGYDVAATTTYCRDSIGLSAPSP